MKRLMLAVATISLLMALSPAVALAGPPSPPDYGNYNPLGLVGPPESWGVEKILPSLAPGGQTHIVTDPLIGPSASGWVTFWCQSKVGFQYNIGATGLNPLSRYSVRAFGIQAIIVPPGTPDAIDTGEGFWILIVDPALDLNLGKFMTDANGLGGVKGVAQLPAGYLYDVGTVVFDGAGIPVLWSPADDPNGFLVY